MTPPRVLLVRFSAIGDCVMVIPSATALRRAHPDAHLVWAVESRCAPVLDTDVLLDAVHAMPRAKWKRKRWSPLTWREQLLAYTSLRAQRFDWGIDFQGHSKTALFLRLAHPARTIAAPGTDPLARRLNPQTGCDWHSLHRVEANLSLLSEFGEFGPEVSWTLPNLAQEAAKVEGLLPSGPFATLVTGAGAPNKLYPTRAWAEVASALLAQGVGVVWLGAAGDPEPEVAGTVSLIGRLGLRESMAAIAASCVHVAGDTGTGHLAAALGVPVVTIFGPMSVDVYRPYTKLGRVLNRDGVPANILPEEVVAAAMELVHERSTSVPR